MKKVLISIFLFFSIFAFCSAKSSPDQKRTGWNVKKLDTARNVKYLSDLEKDVILEMNMARTNPKKYAKDFIEPQADLFEGTLYDGYLRTEEGAPAVIECVKAMSSAKAAPILYPSKGMSKAAAHHVKAICPKGLTGHKSPDGLDPFDRMDLYGSWKSSAAENISYGDNTAREIVIALLIDDGVSSRGHRKNILDIEMNKTGVAFSDSHKEWKYVCVIDYAADYIEK